MQGILKIYLKEMQYKVKFIDSFEKQAKKLRKKYPSIEKEILDIVKKLETHPNIGIPIGKNCYKIRISIASKGKGKSGGARIITHFIVSNDSVCLMSIYDKSDKDSISDKELDEMLCNLRNHEYTIN